MNCLESSTKKGGLSEMKKSFLTKCMYCKKFYNCVLEGEERDCVCQDGCCKDSHPYADISHGLCPDCGKKAIESFKRDCQRKDIGRGYTD